MRTVEHQLVEDAGEQLLENPGAAREQAMHVPTLRHTAASGGGGQQQVTLHHCDGVEEVGQRARGQQPGHAGSQYHRVTADLGFAGQRDFLHVHRLRRAAI
jgi:hypothetical protein